MGCELDRGAPCPPGHGGPGGAGVVSGVSPVRRRLELAAESDRGAVDSAAAQDDGSGRVRLRFLPDGGDVRVPSGTPVFDAASWNGIAIDSTCGGHGTCRKCKVRILAGEAPVTALDTRAFGVEDLRSGWRLACRVEVATDLRVEVAPPLPRRKPAPGGVGRKVILRPAVQKRYVELPEGTLSDQASDLERLL